MSELDRMNENDIENIKAEAELNREMLHLVTLDMLRLRKENEKRKQKNIELHKQVRTLQLNVSMAVKYMKEFLDCQNNDCKCREGFGLCCACKEVAHDFINDNEKKGGG